MEPLNVIWTTDIRNGVVTVVIKDARLWLVLVDYGRTFDMDDLNALLNGDRIKHARLFSTYYGLYRRENHLIVRILAPKGHQGGNVALVATRLQIETPTTTFVQKWPVDNVAWKAFYLWYYSAVLDVCNVSNKIAPRRKPHTSVVPIPKSAIVRKSLSRG